MIFGLSGGTRIESLALRDLIGGVPEDEKIKFHFIESYFK